ncbi:MAG: diaminopimelate decarboxylase [Gammaproteobacteria bacterium]
MSAFHYCGSALYCEKVPLSRIAQTYGTPCYVYSRTAIESNWRVYDEAFMGHPHLLCYAVKANANLGVLNLLSRLGSGFDIVSVGELERVLHAGGGPSKIVFSGIGKREDEMQRALEVGIRCFNVESEPELLRLDRVARSLGETAPVAVRINPDVDANTHPYIATGLKENKFGVAMDVAHKLYHAASRMPALSIVGVACHIGSQLLSISPLIAACGHLLKLARTLRKEGIPIRHLDLGGGLGIQYQHEQPPSPREYVGAILSLITKHDFEIVLAPGRSIVGPAGMLLTRVEFIKRTVTKSFAIVDAAMTELLRPALYNAWQGIVPVLKRHEGAPDRYDVVGPVCESGDFLGKDRSLNVRAGDLLAVQATGAYGFCLSSNYNARPRPPEVIIDGETVHTVREREHLVDLWRGEAFVPL